MRCLLPLCLDALRIVLCISYQIERRLVFKTNMATLIVASSMVCSVLHSLCVLSLYIYIYVCVASKDAASVSRTVSHCDDKPLGVVDEYVFTSSKQLNEDIIAAGVLLECRRDTLKILQLHYAPMHKSEVLRLEGKPARQGFPGIMTAGL